jgi:hypothetical protein
MSSSSDDSGCVTELAGFHGDQLSAVQTDNITQVFYIPDAESNVV